MPKKSSPTHQTISGRIWKYGDDINTDVIFPGKYTYTLREPEEMAAHALEDLDPDFAGAVQPGDVIVAGRNFGNGSSREQAVTCLRAAGIEAIVAVSFGRIYYRNAINNGLLAIVCPQAVESAEQGQSIQIDPHAHIIIISDQEIEFPALSQTAQKILSAGGLIPYVKQSLKSTAGSTG